MATQVMITREDANSLIPVENVREIFQGVIKTSAVLPLMRKLPNMSSKKTRIKILDNLPLAFWQATDNSRKKLTKQKWKDKFIEAEELAVIVPISEAVLDDAEYDIWAEVQPRIVEAMQKKIDEAIIFGTGKPASFPEGIVQQATSKVGFNIEYDDKKSLYLNVSEAMGVVEGAGFNPNGILGGVGLKKDFRNTVDANGNIMTNLGEVGALNRGIVDNGAWDNEQAKFVVGDFNEAVYAIRQDVTVKLLTEGVIQDPDDNTILYNLGQDDMVALRVTFRLGWQLPNPVTVLNSGAEATRLPFCAVKNAIA